MRLLRSEKQGPLRRMFIEAKVTELHALQLRQHEARAAFPQTVHLSKREIDRMHEARSRVLTQLG